MTNFEQQQTVVFSVVVHLVGEPCPEPETCVCSTLDACFVAIRDYLARVGDPDDPADAYALTEQQEQAARARLGGERIAFVYDNDEMFAFQIERQVLDVGFPTIDEPEQDNSNEFPRGEFPPL